MSKANLHDGNIADDRNLLLLILGTGFLAGIIYQWQLWSLTDEGLSLLSERLPFWDFSNLWAGGYFARHGDVGILFDVDAYRTSLRTMFGHALPNQEWSYPPSILLLGVPLSLLPIGLAYAVWSVVTLACLYAVLRMMRFTPTIALLLSLCPAEMMNLLLGQNGALTAALLLGSLVLVPQRPILAGILAGLLTIKPHLGLILPFCFIAGGHWRTFVSASITVVVLVLVTGIGFGFQVWPLFIRETGTLMSNIMEAPFLQPYQKNAMTVFIAARWLGAGVQGAYVAQGLSALLAGFAAVWLWRPDSKVDHHLRVALCGLLAVMATPYGYSYDAIPVCVAAASLYLRKGLQLPKWLLGLTYLWPVFLHVANGQKLAIGILPPALLAILAVGHLLLAPGKHSLEAEVRSSP